jgi:Uma2 family endonuclease
VVLKDRHLTLEQFLELPERKPPLEYEDGQVTRNVSPKLKHIVIQDWVVHRVNAIGRPRRVARAFPELRATFAGRSVVPDVAVYRCERLPRSVDGEWLDDVRDAPDVIVGVVSPRQSITRLIRHCLWYVRNGVRAALLVDEKDRSVVAFRPGVDTQTVRGADAVDVRDPVPDLRFTADELFSAPRAD